MLSGFAVKSPLIKPPPLYVYNHWGFQTDEQEQMSRDQRTFSPADPPDVGKKFFSALTIFLPKNALYHYRNLVMTLLEKWRLHLQEILYDNQSLKPYFPISACGMRNLLDLMAISFITMTFCNTVQQKIYYSHILPGNDGLDHSLACENGKYVGGRCNILTISQLWQLFIREKKKRNQIETVWAIEDKVVGKY